mmetsp:Transcript_79232/g.124956  ORF Transcript_79232/g.124956 Transcript_79232/m.124956 type:complete len:239 (-) Transcript_79232:377-1093(-)
MHSTALRGAGSAKASSGPRKCIDGNRIMEGKRTMSSSLVTFGSDEFSGLFQRCSSRFQSLVEPVETCRVLGGSTTATSSSSLLRFVSISCSSCFAFASAICLASAAAASASAANLAASSFFLFASISSCFALASAIFFASSTCAAIFFFLSSISSCFALGSAIFFASSACVATFAASLSYASFFSFSASAVEYPAEASSLFDLRAFARLRDCSTFRSASNCATSQGLKASMQPSPATL